MKEFWKRLLKRGEKILPVISEEIKEEDSSTIDHAQLEEPTDFLIRKELKKLELTEDKIEALLSEHDDTRYNSRQDLIESCLQDKSNRAKLITMQNICQLFIKDSQERITTDREFYHIDDNEQLELELCSMKNGLWDISKEIGNKSQREIIMQLAHIRIYNPQYQEILENNIENLFSSDQEERQNARYKIIGTCLEIDNTTNLARHLCQLFFKDIKEKAIINNKEESEIREDIESINESLRIINNIDIAMTNSRSDQHIDEYKEVEEERHSNPSPSISRDSSQTDIANHGRSYMNISR